ncbi:MAG: TlpA family protein disulfide reductase [Acidimicrobiales bacterium]
MTVPERPAGRDFTARRHARPARRRYAKVAAGFAALVAATLGAHVVGTRLGASRSKTVLSSSPVTPATAPAGAPSSAGKGSAAPLAPNGTFVTPAGVTMTVASFRGAPTMVWFVIGGCASCEASIPAVVAHFGQIAGDGVRVVTLGMYGAFPGGEAGAGQVVSFGRAAAGGSVMRPGWTWGMASEALSLAYDPSGTPDTYVLIGPGGHIRYRNSIPDSTMPQLLAAAAALTGHSQATPPTRTEATSATTQATLP